MSSGTQVDLDWAGTDGARGGVAGPPASAPNPGAKAGGAYLTDEEILGIEPPSLAEASYGGQGRHGSDSIVRNGAQQDGIAEAGGAAEAGAAKTTQAEVFSLMTSFTQRSQDILYTRLGR